MTMDPWRTLKIAACLLVLILASGFAGGLIGRRLTKIDLERRSDPKKWNEAAMRTFDRTVRPTDAQRVKLQAVLDAAVEELKAVRADTIGRSKKIILRLVDEIERELTPEQKAAFEAMKPKPGELDSLEVLDVDPRKG
jgi:hypothetical protein